MLKRVRLLGTASMDDCCLLGTAEVESDLAVCALRKAEGLVGLTFSFLSSTAATSSLVGFRDLKGFLNARGEAGEATGVIG